MNSGTDLFRKKILTLPDCHCLEDYYLIVDGLGYIVEINLNGAYRSYGCGSPQFDQKTESKQMLKILRLIYPDWYFGVEEK